MELGFVDQKDIVTKDGKKVGMLVGANVDTADWTVPTILVEVNKDLVLDLGLQKSMLKSPKVNISTDLVEVVGDIIHLNIDLNGLKEHV